MLKIHLYTYHTHTHRHGLNNFRDISAVQNEGLPEHAPRSIGILVYLFLLHFETKKAVFLLLTLQTLLRIIVLNHHFQKMLIQISKGG